MLDDWNKNKHDDLQGDRKNFIEPFFNSKSTPR